MERVCTEECLLNQLNIETHRRGVRAVVYTALGAGERAMSDLTSTQPVYDARQALQQSGQCTGRGGCGAKVNV
jgi:hypothetical protein